MSQMSIRGQRGTKRVLRCIKDCRNISPQKKVQILNSANPAVFSLPSYKMIFPRPFFRLLLRSVMTREWVTPGHRVSVSNPIRSNETGYRLIIVHEMCRALTSFYEYSPLWRLAP